MTFTHVDAARCPYCARVRIVLAEKGIEHGRVEVDLHARPDWLFELNPPGGRVPVLDTLPESEVIMEYLEETHPEPPLLPKEPLARAWVRAFALVNVADSHPLIVPRIRNYLAKVLNVSEAQKLAWIQHWLGLGLQAMESLVVGHGSKGRFCHGDSPTIADICLATQVFPAMNFKCDLAPYPNCKRIYDTCMAIPAFAAAHPMKQADAE